MNELAPYIEEPSAHEAFENLQKEPETPLDALSRQELLFLLGYIKDGDAAGAARRAGYSPNMALMAASLLDKPHIRKALWAIRATQRETLRQRQINSAAIALDMVQSVVVDETVGHETRLKAAMKLIDISGSTAPREMADELRDDAPVERVDKEKIALAFNEAEKAKDI